MRLTISFLRYRDRQAVIVKIFAILQVIFGSLLNASTPEEYWAKDPVKTVLPSTTPDVSSTSELSKAISFRQLCGRALSGENPDKWRTEMEAYAGALSNDPVTSGIREAALVWVARLRMEEINSLLREFYANQIRFPKGSSEFASIIPSSLAKDPWGNNWVYQAEAPKGFPEMLGQRYHLAPSKYPSLETLKEVRHSDPMPAFSPTIRVVTIGDHTALEMHFAGSVSVIGPGGNAAGMMLIYIGDHWALFSGADRLFAVNF
jgi:hypothetical protein